MSEIRLSIRSADLRSLNLEGLDVVLSKHCYKGLQRLTFDVDDSGSTPRGRADVDAMLCERLPTGDAQGLLNLELRG